jgi:outer membrane usher protein
MSVRRCVRHEVPMSDAAAGKAFLVRLALFVFMAILFSSMASRASAAEAIVAEVVLNQERKGAFIVYLGDDGDVLVKPADLMSMGFREPSGHRVLMGGEEHLSLRSMQSVSFAFVERTLTLEIIAAPDLLPVRSISFGAERNPRVIYPRETSAFLNYRFDYFSMDPAVARTFAAAAELGVRTSDYLFLSDGIYSETAMERRFVRLMSSVTYDRPRAMDRVIAGDLIASSGDLGTVLNLGGVSYSRVYGMNPSFVRYPTIDYSGLVSLPSDMEVYLNGARVRTEKLRPGEFEIIDLTAQSGAGNLEILIRDPFGREQRFSHPYYMTEVLLKEGLHDFSYGAGFFRRNFGVKNDDYGPLAAAGFHRYGITDALTIGIRGDGGDGTFSLGPQVVWRAGAAGVVSSSLSRSFDTDGKEGTAGSLGYGYRSGSYSGRLLARGFTEHYQNVGVVPPAEKTRLEAGAGIGYSTRQFGSLSVDAAVVKKHAGLDRETEAITYSRNIARNASMYATLRRIEEGNSPSYEFFLGFTLYPAKEYTVASNYQRYEGGQRGSVQVQKSQPSGEGAGYRAQYEYADDQERITTASASMQYNAPYGIYRGDYTGRNGDSGNSSTYALSAAGAAVYADGSIGFVRPVHDGFALVRAGGLQGVRVYHNNQEVGRTDASGKAFIPNLGSYYENQISISDKDIPIDYYMPEVRRFVSPPLRGAAVLAFEVRKIQAVTGTLSLRRGKKAVPVEFHEVTMVIGEEERSFPTGRGGEFFVEDVPAGRHRVSVVIDGEQHAFDLDVPKSDEMIIDLGGILL